MTHFLCQILAIFLAVALLSHKIAARKLALLGEHFFGLFDVSWLGQTDERMGFDRVDRYVPRCLHHCLRQAEFGRAPGPKNRRVREDASVEREEIRRVRKTGPSTVSLFFQNVSDMSTLIKDDKSCGSDVLYPLNEDRPIGRQRARQYIIRSANIIAIHHKEFVSQEIFCGPEGAARSVQNILFNV